jgi:hypothetical protein
MDIKKGKEIDILLNILRNPPSDDEVLKALFQLKKLLIGQFHNHFERVFKEINDRDLFDTFSKGCKLTIIEILDEYGMNYTDKSGLVMGYLIAFLIKKNDEDVVRQSYLAKPILLSIVKIFPAAFVKFVII